MFIAIASVCACACAVFRQELGKTRAENVCVVGVGVGVQGEKLEGESDVFRLAVYEIRCSPPT